MLGIAFRVYTESTPSMLGHAIFLVMLALFNLLDGTMGEDLGIKGYFGKVQLPSWDMYGVRSGVRLGLKRKSLPKAQS